MSSCSVSTDANTGDKGRAWKQDTRSDDNMHFYWLCENGNCRHENWNEVEEGCCAYVEVAKGKAGEEGEERLQCVWVKYSCGKVMDLILMWVEIVSMRSLDVG